MARIDNRYAALIYRLVFLFLCGAGLLLHFYSPGKPVNWAVLNYYTILSNLICFLFFLSSATYLIRNIGKPVEFSYAPRTEAAVVVWITLTLVTYHFVLLPGQFRMSSSQGVFTIKNMIVHYIVPTMVIADWFLFVPKGNIRWADPLKWLAVPALYLFYILVRTRFAGNISNTGSPYPYAFIDVAYLGVGQVMLNVLVVALGIVCIGYAIYAIDRLSVRGRA